MRADDTRIADLNRAQGVSERDDFTEERYRQFISHCRPGDQTVLDIGCNTGRSSAVIKKLRPDLGIVGMDCVEERLTALDPQVYNECWRWCSSWFSM